MPDIDKIDAIAPADPAQERAEIPLHEFRTLLYSGIFAKLADEEDFVDIDTAEEDEDEDHAEQRERIEELASDETDEIYDAITLGPVVMSLVRLRQKGEPPEVVAALHHVLVIEDGKPMFAARMREGAARREDEP